MFNQQPRHGVIWSKLLGEWSRLLSEAAALSWTPALSWTAVPHGPGALHELWLRGAALMPVGMFPPGITAGSASTRAGEALVGELASLALGRWLHWVDASAWLAKDTLNYVLRLQVEFAQASQELHAQSLSGNP